MVRGLGRRQSPLRKKTLSREEPPREKVPWCAACSLAPCSARASDASHAAADGTMYRVPELDTHLPLSVCKKLHWLCRAGVRAGTAPTWVEPVRLCMDIRYIALHLQGLACRQAMHSPPSRCTP